MKKLLRNLLLALSLAAFSAAYGAGTPTLDVAVTDASGKVAYKGKTSSSGTFATGKLAPGNYTVQFNSKSVPSGHYMLVVSSGKKKVSADAVDAGKFAKGGVAMKVEGVAGGMNITGQVANAAAATNNSNVRIIKGKRYVWVKNTEAGSNLGGKWVEEGSPEASSVLRLSRDSLNKMQEHGDAHQEGFPGR